jgi:hypothetical protein
MAVYNFIKSTPNVKSIFFASNWREWTEFTEQHFNYTLHLYRQIGVNVYVIQQPPVQPHDDVVGMYKKLLNDGKLTDKNLRKYSVNRTKYDKDQKPF